MLSWHMLCQERMAAGRLPQELRLRGIREWANPFLSGHYIAGFNRLFTVRQRSARHRLWDEK
jgi:hypothetical protein